MAASFVPNFTPSALNESVQDVGEREGEGEMTKDGKKKSKKEKEEPPGKGSWRRDASEDVGEEDQGVTLLAAIGSGLRGVAGARGNNSNTNTNINTNTSSNSNSNSDGNGSMHVLTPASAKNQRAAVQAAGGITSSLYVDMWRRMRRNYLAFRAKCLGHNGASVCMDVWMDGFVCLCLCVLSH